MEYLKVFMESRKSLQEFCENHLIYLMDDGLQLQVVKNRVNANRENLYYVNLSYPSKQQSKHWESIRDVIIPFFIHLSRSYMVTQTDSFDGIIGNQIEFGLVRNQVGHMGIQRKKLSLTIQDLEDELVSKIGAMLNEMALVESISFFVTEVTISSPSKPSMGKRIKRYLGF